MTDLMFINFVYGFLVNDILGDIRLLVLLIMIVVMGLLFFARVPRLVLTLFGLAIISVLATNAYVIQQWVLVLAWIAGGVVWYNVMRSATQ